MPHCARSSSGWRPNASGCAGRTGGCGPRVSGCGRPTSGCGPRWRRCAGPASGRPPRSPGTTPRLIPSVPGASPARPTAGMRTGSHPSRSTGSWRSGCRDAVLAVAANWSWNRWRLSMSRTCPSRARCASAMRSMWAAADRAACGSSLATRRRPRMRWGRLVRSWVPGQWRWRPGLARGWGCQPPRSPGCWASSGCASPLVGSRERSPGPLAAPSPPTSR